LAPKTNFVNPQTLNMKRNLFIDSIRGLLLVIMLVDHTPLFIRRYTASSFGFFDGAEGFIFISAYLFGLIYSKYLQHSSFLIRKTFKRVWVIYKYHIASVIVLHLLIYGIIHYSQGSISVERFDMEEISIMYVLKSLFIVKQSAFLDILPLYIMLISLSPFILLGFKYNYKITLLISFVLWAFIQFPYVQNLYEGILTKWDINFGSFNIFGWQFLFTIGLLLGHRTFYNKNKINYSPKIVFVILVVAFSFFVLRHILPKLNDQLFWTLIGNKQYLQTLRLFNFIIVLYLVSFINKYYSISKQNFFSYIGRYSIDVFTFHLLIIYLINLNTEVGQLSKPVQLILGIVVVSTLIIPAIIKEEFTLDLKNERSKRIQSRLTLIILLPKNVIRIIRKITSCLFKKNAFFLQNDFGRKK
jgi:hypothetical protein